ncbi:hypothetical protein RJ640_017040 [Escallonia rubra]|uniref:F-box associated beta-propeller type 3 domain-containing protein n=1 Tax=Escallonia rubra TaxID=112253 RepID=A0AA88QGS8_9ASTE|nr:hypothetical protein RJ640_017040 [Escallonia rubra]
MSASTHWHSTISAPSFLISHLSQSFLSRPNASLTLLFTIPSPSASAYLIYSAAIPVTIRYQIESVAAKKNLTVPGFPYASSYIPQSIHGFICLAVSLHRVCICNPTTRQSFTLPRPPPFSVPIRACHSTYSFGFDPARNQHKVLLTALAKPPDGCDGVVEHWVFTLIGGGEWRRISCPITRYFSVSAGTYINGSIYRLASYGSDDYAKRTHVVEFDVGSEDFRLVELPDEVQFRDEEGRSLVEIDGHLGIIDYRGFGYGGNGIKIWVLEGDSNWVKRSIMFPVPDWGDIRDRPRLWYKGTIYTGEMMFAPSVSTANSLYCVFFYDITVNLLRRFNIQGLPECSGDIDTVYIADHVETLLSLPRGKGASGSLWKRVFLWRRLVLAKFGEGNQGIGNWAPNKAWGPCGSNLVADHQWLGEFPKQIGFGVDDFTRNQIFRRSFHDCKLESITCPLGVFYDVDGKLGEPICFEFCCCLLCSHGAHTRRVLLEQFLKGDDEHNHSKLKFAANNVSGPWIAIEAVGIINFGVLRKI